MFGVPVTLASDPWEAPRWDISGDSCVFTDEDRRQWRLRLPGYIVADHLSAEPAFLAMVARVRASHDTAPAAWCEAACFSPRGGAKGGRRALMARLLEVSAAAAPGDEERALQGLLPGAWTVPGSQGGRAVAPLQARYVARLWIGARVLACRAAGRCVECDIAAKTHSRAHAGDYCCDHLLDADHEQLAATERLRLTGLRHSKVRHRKAVEHLFRELAAALPAQAI